MEYKLPEGFDSRGEAIESIMKKEIDSGESELVLIKQDVEKFLLDKKGYSKDEIETDKEFDVVIGNEICKSKADIIISIDGGRLILIKCSAGALVSRERQALACARVLDSYQIPFAVVTDGKDATMLNTVTGEVISEGLEKIPSKDGLKKIMGQIEFKELAANRVEKEKRILLAFDAIKCSINYGE